MATENTTANGTQEQDTAPVWNTLEEAKANKPADCPPKHRIFVVLKDGKPVGYRWCGGPNNALVAVCRRDGYTASAAESKRGEVTKEAAAAKLAEFTDEELAALGLTRKKGKK